MKIKKLFGNWTTAIKTFPISHVLLFVITIFAILEVAGYDQEWMNKLLIALPLAFIISTYGPLFSIHLKNSNRINWILQLVSLLIGGIYYRIIYNIEGFFHLRYSENFLYLGVLPLAFLGIPLILAWLQKKQQPKIRFSWTSLIFSMIFGGIAGLVVRGGIASALGSIEALFDVDINYKRYGYIGVVSNVLLTGSFIFNYYLTLVGDVKSNNFEIQPSRLRKIFGSYIFLPLALIYLLIFLAYGLKILVTGIWPKGIIVRLGIGYFSLGIVSSYMIYPEKTKWYETINKILFISFILVALMMIGAISQRIAQYGITINRRFICYGIAAIIITSLLSLIFSKTRLITFVSTLFVLTILAIYGPISANNISYHSQVSRLEKLLAEENIELPLGTGAFENLTGENTRLILGALDELVEKYNENKIVGKIILMDYSYKSTNYYYLKNHIREYLKLNDNNDDYYRTENEYFYFSIPTLNDGWNLDVNDFSKLYSINEYDIKNNELKIKKENLEYNFSLAEITEDIYKNSQTVNGDVERENIVINEGNYKLIITEANGERERGTNNIVINHINGYLLIK